MTMKRNEHTSKAVASRASQVMNDAPVMIASFKRMQRELSDAIKLLEGAVSVSASALTQAADKKGGKR